MIKKLFVGTFGVALNVIIYIFGDSFGNSCDHLVL